jgi:L-ascorbate 6-phosphate lactonase
MIQPVNSGRGLLDEIEQADCPSPMIWWLGQSGFAIKHRGRIVYIDPYLSESLTKKYKDTNKPHIRMTECPLNPADITHADLILCSHKHSDHLDPGTVPAMLIASMGASLVLPRSLVEHAAAMGVPRERIFGTDAGARIQGFIHVIPAAHEALDYTPETGYPYLGFVLRLGDVTIYHSGDCVPYDGLVDRLRPFDVTVALLPINGSDPKRGVAGNFNIEQAAQLAADIGAEWLVPTHYDMFTFNTADPGDFVRHMDSRSAGARYKVMQCGEGWRIPAE